MCASGSSTYGASDQEHGAPARHSLPTGGTAAGIAFQQAALQQAIAFQQAALPQLQLFPYGHLLAQVTTLELSMSHLEVCIAP